MTPDPTSATPTPPRIPPAIVEAREAAETARRWATREAGAAAVPVEAPYGPGAAAHPSPVSGTDPARDVVSCTADPSAHTPTPAALIDLIEDEVRRYAHALIAAAWDVAEPDVNVHPPEPRPVRSPHARAHARGVVPASWRTGRFTGRRGYVCLDCGWVGALIPLHAGTREPDAAAAAAHTCPQDHA